MPLAPRPWRLAFAAHETWSKTLLVCGMVSSLLYGAMIGAIRFEGYSRISQVPSELTAIGAPTRPLWMLLGAVYTVLVTAFGWGVWKVADRSRALRIAGGLILAYGSLGLLWPFAAMHQRDVLAAGGGTLSDTAHVVLGGVTVFLMFLAIGFGATAFGKRFRLYSIASIVVLLTFGGLTFLEAPRLQTNLATPWIGLWERINISVFLLWVVVLAAALLRQEHRRRDAMSQPSPFKTAQGEARFVAAYDDALKLWPVPYEQLDIPTRFGLTHVVAAGPKNAPPLVDSLTTSGTLSAAGPISRSSSSGCQYYWSARPTTRTSQRRSCAGPRFVRGAALRARPRNSLSRYLDFNRLRFRRRSLRQMDVQHPVLEFRPDLLRLDLGRQRELTDEFSIGPLHFVELLAFLLLFAFALPFDRENALEHFHFHVLFRHVGQLRLDQILLVGLFDVDGRCPVGEEDAVAFERAQRRLAEQAVQATLHLFQITERTPLDDVHISPSLGTWEIGFAVCCGG